MKLHAAVTCVLKAIPSMEVTGGEVNDSSQLGALLDSLPLQEAVTADAGYLSRRNCDLIEAKGAKPYIKIKKNIRLIRAWGSKAWVDMILEWRRNPKEWNKRYNMRSSAESAFSAIKKTIWSPALVDSQRLAAQRTYDKSHRIQHQHTIKDQLETEPIYVCGLFVRNDEVCV